MPVKTRVRRTICEGKKRQSLDIAKHNRSATDVIEWSNQALDFVESFKLSKLHFSQIIESSLFLFEYFFRSSIESSIEQTNRYFASEIHHAHCINFK